MRLPKFEIDSFIQIEKEDREDLLIIRATDTRNGKTRRAAVSKKTFKFRSRVNVRISELKKLFVIEQTIDGSDS